MEERKGFFTPEQEEILDNLIELSGIAEKLDGPVIRLADNRGLEVLKNKIAEKYPDAIPVIFEIIDALFEVLPKKEG